MLVYLPKLVRPLLYGHLLLLYSLLIAALISILATELTQSDGIFILVTVASPASIYIWVRALVSLWKPNWFLELFHKPLLKPPYVKPRVREARLLKALILASLAFEIAMICVMLIPSEHLKFSQPGCKWEYTGQEFPEWALAQFWPFTDHTLYAWVAIVWEITYIIQILWILITVGGSSLIFKLVYRKERKEVREHPDSTFVTSFR